MNFEYARALLRALIVGVISICLVSTQAHAQNKKITMPMTKDAAVIHWKFDPAGEMKIAVMIAPVEGKVAVCGFWAVTYRLPAGVKRSQLPRQARMKTSAYVGKLKLTDGLRKLNKVSKEDFLSGTSANCELTQHAWHSSFSNDELMLQAPNFRSF